MKPSPYDQEVAVKKRYPFLILSVIIATFFSAAVAGQNHEGAYMHIDYIQIAPDEEDVFTRQIKEAFSPVQEARIGNGHITDWYLYRVTYPGVPNSFYNYVIITISDSISGFVDVAAQFDEVEEASELDLGTYKKLLAPSHSELWRIRNSVLFSEDTKPSRYMVKNFMSVNLGYEYEYQMFEDEVARPIHEERMEREIMRGWELNELLIPGGTDYGYNFSTIDHFNKLEHIEYGFTVELIRQTHPETNINEFFDNIYRTRDLVRSEVWEWVDLDSNL